MTRFLRTSALLTSLAIMSLAVGQTASSSQHDALVARLRAVAHVGESFGPAYAPLYRVILPWYEKWGGRNDVKVDDWAVAPEVYAAELADALEHGRNFIAEHPASTFPVMFERKLPNGQVSMENYQLHLPKGFPNSARKYPLFIGLPGSGWIAHKISYGRGEENRDNWISVVPILESGDWQIKFLNEYLDELLKILPVDPDKVYVSGHSLGGMATWNWATSNPERFAAIFPEDGYGQPYRAVRLKNVAVWAIHGELDTTILPGLAEQMVSAVRAAGGTALYSLLKGAPHNIPSWFDSEPVTQWCLRQTRSHKPAPPDPRNAIKLSADGFSKWSLVDLPAGMYWRAEGQLSERRPGGPAVASLFAKAEGRDALIDSPIQYVIDSTTHTSSLWLSVPLPLQTSSKNDPSIVKLPARQAIQFYFSGTPDKAYAHLTQIQKELKSGQSLSPRMWITPLGPDRDNSRTQLFLCQCELT